ncbi:hypothetical protein LUCX_53 [Xanthomonas phage vB_XciM_LucasX]|nr:hypothetical protein LUCX_53 [Xanthomonas phage vB_XciM_LucasX]
MSSLNRPLTLRRDPKAPTVGLIMGTTFLQDRYSGAMHYWTGTHSLMIICAILLDLFVTTDGATYSPEEIRDHLAAEMHASGLVKQQEDALPHPVMGLIAHEIYLEMCQQLWPQFLDLRPDPRTVCLRRADHLVLEIGFTPLA